MKLSFFLPGSASDGAVADSTPHSGELAYKTLGVCSANDTCIASRCVITSVVLLAVYLLDSVRVRAACM